MKIFIIAGEASGDMLASSVMIALKSKQPDVEFRGIGGSTMMASGLPESLFPMEDLSLMGIMEVVPKIPKMLKRIRQTVEAIKVFNPDIVLTVDAPDFSFRVQKELKRHKLKAKQLHFVAPTVWAWRPDRARKIAAFLDGLICLLPFEPPFFQRQGLSAIAVGHPVLKAGALEANGGLFRQAHDIAQDTQVVGLFFGSRRSEIELLSPVILGVAKSMANEHPDIRFIVPTLPRWKDHLEGLLKAEGLKAIVTDDKAEKWDAIAACDVALVVSGTVALEIAVVGVPHAILYRMNALTWQIVSRVVKTRHAHLVNVILQDTAVPEFLQDEAQVELILPKLKELLASREKQAKQKEAFQRVREMLQPDPALSAADQAAEFILKFKTQT